MTILAIVAGLLLGKAADLLLPSAYRGSPFSAWRTRCSECSRAVSPADAIPFAEALRRGRCAGCGEAAPLRWLFLPAATAALGGMCYLEFGDIGQALVGTLFSAIFLSLVVTDLERRLLPDRIVLPSIVAAVALGWALPDGSLVNSMFGLALGIAVAAALVVGSLPFGGGAFGMGDAKLIVMLGALLGPQSLIVAVFVAVLAAGIAAALLLASRLARRGSHIAFGPFLAAGGIAAMLWGTELWDWWAR